MPTKQTIKTEIVEPDNAPGVIAYRVGQLEETVKRGFKEHNDKLDTLVNNFASKADLADHESRLRVVEAEKNLLRGAVKVIYAVLVLIVGLVGALWWVRG